ncbi:hypothetical protein FACS1894202_01970 [Clostridia bacterium]|nr:hypothetical protein FACS1894202_01970 [Clostridia bacterium]
MSANVDKYSVTQYSVNGILGSIENGEIAIPEIQRPFVWKAAQVRDLLDSLYNGYPTGYLIIWQNPNVKLKNGKDATGKKVLIDGQQRVTALMTSVAGLPVLDDDYQERVIRIAFNPIAETEDERFAVTTPAHEKSAHWIPDISAVFKPDFDSYEFVDSYAVKNPTVSKKDVNQALTRLSNIRTCQIGAIILNAELDIGEVTEIFVRINSKGAVLKQADFAMSKIAADELYGGNTLRKAIDYFCHLAVEPSFWSLMSKNDSAFMQTDYAQKMKWLKDDKEKIYDPDYDDMLRVAFMHRFGKGKLGDLVSLLSGRNFELRTFDAQIAEDSFAKLRLGVLDFMNEYNFEQFILALKSAGFSASKLLNSRMTLDFAYMLYLRLHASGDVSKQEVKRYVQKWFVLSTLTSRYIASPESKFDRDLRGIDGKGFLPFFAEAENADLSDTFWEVGLPQALETSSISSPYFNVYTAAQICGNDRSLLSANAKVGDLLTAGDVHHIFPKEYLKQSGITDKSAYNQVANYVYLDTSINIAIGKKSPAQYFGAALAQVRGGDSAVGTITSENNFWSSLAVNSVPDSVVNMTADDYPEFLAARRKLMAKKVRDYYFSL